MLPVLAVLASNDWNPCAKQISQPTRLVKGGQLSAATAKILGIPKQTLENWVRLANNGQLKEAGDKPVSPEEMDLARLRAENARLRMERDILGKATAYWANSIGCRNISSMEVLYGKSEGVDGRENRSVSDAFAGPP